MRKVEMECGECGATGVYKGFAEQDGVGVVCSHCKGTGRQVLEYKPFIVRRLRRDITIVQQVNPGIMVDASDRFGGIPYADWEQGKGFPDGTENRECVCPAWWYQSADYKRKPDWEECNNLGIAFRNCPLFATKEKCWQRFDRESKNE